MTSTITTQPRGRRIGVPVRRPRATGIMVAALIVVASTYVAAAIRPAPGLTPNEDGTGTAGDPTTIDAPAGAPGALVALSVDQLDRSIAAWSANLAAEPRDFLSATNLATLYHGRGQLSGDLTDHERALEAAATALAIAPTDAQARAIDATIRFTLHDFAGAFTAADALYRDDPSQLGALATRADAGIELGQIDAARRDLAVLAVATDGPPVDIRLARLASVTGQADEALRLSQVARAGAIDAARSSVVDLGFYEYAVGEFARLAGDARMARTAFEAALVIRATDLGALVGLARIDAYEGRTEAALAHLETATAVAPQPEALALLGDLRVTVGDRAGAEAAYRTVRFIGELGAIQGAVYDRQLLRFELDHGRAEVATLEAVRASVEARPDAAGHDLLAWALHRLGRETEAAGAIEAARAAGAEDARLRFHAGAIQMALGNRDAGATSIEAALAEGPALDPLERAEARRLLAR